MKEEDRIEEKTLKQEKMGIKAVHIDQSNFLDWELSFRGLKPKIIDEKYTFRKEKLSSNGISDAKFKDFMKTWEKKNKRQNKRFWRLFYRIREKIKNKKQINIDNFNKNI